MKVMISHFIDSRYKIILLLIFIASILIGTIKVLLFPPLINVVSDEMLYLSLARSIHYDNTLLYHGQPSQYFNLLYPLLISAVYFFYSPDTIIYALKIIGAICISLVAFSTFALSKKILKDNKKALLIAFISVLLPEMCYSTYIITEVMYYPLAILALLLIYNDIQQPKMINVLWVALISFTLILCKTTAIAVCFGYLGALAINFVLIEKNKNFIHLVMKILTYVITLLVLIMLYKAIFDNLVDVSGIEGIDNIPNITKLGHLTIDYSFFVTMLTGSNFYLFFTMTAFLIFPILMPIMGFRHYGDTDKQFIVFIFSTYLISILMIVYTIYRLEGGIEMYPQRVHTRYLFYLFIPFIIMTFKIPLEKLKLNICCIALILFYIGNICFRKEPFLHNLGRIDTMMLTYLFAIEFVKVLGVIFSVFVIGCLAIMLYLIATKKMIKRMYHLFITIIFASCILNTLLIGYTNIKTDFSVGVAVDAKKLAHFLDERDESLLFIPSETPYSDKIFILDAYLKSSSKFIAFNDLKTIYEADSTINLKDIVPPSYQPDYNISKNKLGGFKYIVVPNDVTIDFTNTKSSDLSLAYYKVYEVMDMNEEVRCMVEGS